MRGPEKIPTSENDVETISDDMILEVREIPADEKTTIAEREKEGLARARERIDAKTEEVSEKYGAGRFLPQERFREFERQAVVNGRIELPQPVLEDAEAKAGAFRRGAKYFTNTIVGERIAAEYDIRTNNFSTQTDIMRLEDGRKVFAVYAHGGSFVHRALDGLMKRLAGLRMRKVRRSKWKEAFEEKSNIPVIRNEDPNTVLMPFIPNVNAYDVFANNHDIENFGGLDWAGEAGAAEKLELADAIVDELSRVHRDGKVWGESILPNIIIDEQKRPIICDPEVRYDASVPNVEAKARDLKDLLLSVCAAMEKGEGVEEYGSTVGRLLARYGDEEVIGTLRDLAGRKRGFLQNLVFGYEQARTGVSGKEQYDAILGAIRAYEKES